MAWRTVFLVAVLWSSAGTATQDVEQALVEWIRANGGRISELVGVRGERSIVALGDIPAKTRLAEIPRKLQLVPGDVARDHELPRRVAPVQGTAFVDTAFAAHIVREVERRKEMREAGEEGDGGVFFAPFWDSIERHLSLVQGPDLWEPEEQQLLGPAALHELRNYKKMYDNSHKAIVKHFKDPVQQLLMNWKADSILGAFDKQQFIRALLMHWSRRFNDGGQGVLVPFVLCLNHRLPKISNVDFELDDDGVFITTAKRDIAEGEELTITYGNWNSDEMLKVYGFTQPPALEPSYRFLVYQTHARAAALPHLAVEDKEATFSLSTPYLNEEEGDVDWTRDLENLIPLRKDNFKDLELLVDFYFEELEKLPLVAPFVAQLRANRLQNKSSHVWWAGDGVASDVDTSSPDALGGARRSDAVRMQMCHFMALAVWREALLVRGGKMAAEDALPVAQALVPFFKQSWAAPTEEDNSAMDEFLGSEPPEDLDDYDPDLDDDHDPDLDEARRSWSYDDDDDDDIEL